MSFIEVKLPEWDCSKVTFGKAPGDGAPTILYDGKMIILSIIGEGRDKYILSSFKGLEQSQVFDSATRRFTDEWDGGWSISFKIADSMDAASPMAKKLVEVFDDIIAKVQKAYKKDISSQPLNFKYEVITDPDTGLQEKGDRMTDKPVYLSVKVPFTHDKGCEMMTSKGNKQEPVFEARYPKPPFYDVTRARDQIAIDPRLASKECAVSMKAVPKLMISTYALNNNVYITKRLMGCYYEPISIGGAGADLDLIDLLRPEMDELDIM